MAIKCTVIDDSDVLAVQWPAPANDPVLDGYVVYVTAGGGAYLESEDYEPLKVMPGDWLVRGTEDCDEGEVLVYDDEEFHATFRVASAEDAADEDEDEDEDDAAVIVVSLIVQQARGRCGPGACCGRHHGVSRLEAALKGDAVGTGPSQPSGLEQAMGLAGPGRLEKALAKAPVAVWSSPARAPRPVGGPGRLERVLRP